MGLKWRKSPRGQQCDLKQWDTALLCFACCFFLIKNKVKANKTIVLLSTIANVLARGDMGDRASLLTWYSSGFLAGVWAIWPGWSSGPGVQASLGVWGRCSLPPCSVYFCVGPLQNFCGLSGSYWFAKYSAKPSREEKLSEGLICNDFTKCTALK